MDRLISIKTGKSVYKDDSLVFKVFYSDDIFAFEEAFKQSLARSLGVVVPFVKGVETVGENYAMVSDYIKGKSLLTLLKNGEIGQRQAIEILAKAQNDVNEKQTNALISNREYFSKGIIRSDLDEKCKQKALKKLLELSGKSCLCHGNLGLKDVVVWQQGYFVTGWGRAYSGDYVSDVAITYVNLVHYCSEDLAQEFLKTALGDNEKFNDWLFVCAVALQKQFVCEKQPVLLKIINDYLQGEKND